MGHPIEVQGLCKSYGKRPILSDLTFHVPRGSVFGFLGRNGSGKTTTMGCLVGLLRRSGGKVEVLGSDPETDDERVKERIGFVSEAQGLPPLENLKTIEALLRNLYPTWDGAYFAELCRKLRIPLDRRIVKLSLGEQRKAAIAVALAPRPELLILDEPAANLDAVVRRELLEELIDLLASQGTTIFFSSHILGDVERIADRVGILSQGKLVFEGAIDSLKEKVVRVRASFSGELPRGLGLAGTLRERRLGSEICATVREFQEPSLRALRERPGVKVELQSMDLEEIFIELTREEGV